MAPKFALCGLCRECCGLRRERSRSLIPTRRRRKKGGSGNAASEGGEDCSGGGGGRKRRRRRMKNGKEDGDSGYPYRDGIGDEDSFSSAQEDEEDGEEERREEKIRADCYRPRGLARPSSVDSHAMLSGFDSPLFRRDCATVDLDSSLEHVDEGRRGSLPLVTSPYADSMESVSTTSKLAVSSVSSSSLDNVQRLCSVYKGCS
ncbi:hypothetical protein ElyMa_002587500 [Elysia marginata]|uniref:Uncharacterized protein n=1 Tax=Elysia marginata TaxID=1093978 RepID=A0AAV4H3W9_9GAST|nr:hypothetical protein ElyMa_002587500 [Elysia marginata]